MYCISCGVKLADTEHSCPLCGTAVYHPDLSRADATPLYPKNRYPKPKANSKVWNGIFIMVFVIAMLLCGIADYQSNGQIDWLGYAIGGLLVGYIAVALPLWFRHPNPVIFVPSNFVSVALYLLYINIASGGNWFLSFAFPLSGTLCIIVSALVTLLHYLKRGHLYVWGGFSIAFGGFIMLLEGLLFVTFGIPFVAWSIYPLIVLTLFGLILIYLAINDSAREAMARKLFF